MDFRVRARTVTVDFGRNVFEALTELQSRVRCLFVERLIIPLIGEFIRVSCAVQTQQSEYKTCIIITVLKAMLFFCTRSVYSLTCFTTGLIQSCNMISNICYRRKERTFRNFQKVVTFSKQNRTDLFFRSTDQTDPVPGEIKKNGVFMKNDNIDINLN